mmetsp:Transcript_54098/g.80720  ORF Transcript_54098/g.80720 Transcript_54098/m.80720 type:complete len:294 (-) Transcript_54098:263-1144(-)
MVGFLHPIASSSSALSLAFISAAHRRPQDHLHSNFFFQTTSSRTDVAWQRHHATTTTKTTSTSIHQDDDGNCVFGKKSYWDEMYKNGSINDRPSDEYSWYCGWDELKPFWNGLLLGDDDDGSKRTMQQQQQHVLIAGIGNDPTPINMYDDGWKNMTAFDYSETGVQRARELFGRRDGTKDNVRLLTADARSLPLPDTSVDATLDKGTLDAIYITGKDAFLDSVKELGRITALSSGMVVCISRVIGPDEFLEAFDTPLWDMVRDGTLAFAPDGEATIDLGAELFAWRRTAVPFA